MRSKSLFTVDIFILISVIFLMATGILFIYSSSITSTGDSLGIPWYLTEWFKQIVWALIGISLMMVLNFIDFKNYQEYGNLLYIGFIGLLILTMFIGAQVKGARSWIGIWEFGIQPSEFTKIVTIIFLSKYYSENHTRIKSISVFSIGLLIIGLPMALTLLQPDLGTASVYFAIFMVISFIAGVKLRYLVYLLLLGAVFIWITVYPNYEIRILGLQSEFGSLLMDFDRLILIAAAFILVSLLSLWGFYSTKNEFLYWLMFGTSLLGIGIIGGSLGHRVLQPYQLDRLIIFLDPYVDEKGAGWNIIQSLNAVGSGGLWGKGYLLGTQSHYSYVPEQSTDFIFSILAEEWGFIGGLVVFGFFMVILVRGIYILTLTKDSFGVFLISGILGMVFFHFFINIGMAAGVMPITGIPLYFLSYGGSSLLTATIGMGILLNIHSKRFV